MRAPTPVIALIGLASVGLQACKSSPKAESHKTPQSQESPHPPEHVNPILDAAGALRFLDTWLETQNSSNFDLYQTLYAADFSGTKRAQDKVVSFDRAQWLADRRPMFDRNAKVSASNVQSFERQDRIELVFVQRWATSTFADVGTKILVLERTPEGYRIQREEMLDSKLDKESMKSPCSKAHQAMEARSKTVRFFADIGIGQAKTAGASRYVEVTSQEDANRRAPDGFAWEFWAVARDGEWLAANMFRTSPSGDWVRFSDHCFRGDGSLAEVTDSHRTFYSQDGLVNDTVTLAFSPDGRVIARAHDAYLMESGKPATPESYMRPDPIMVMHTKQLPFQLTE